MNTYKIHKANDIHDAHPVTGRYDESAIRADALALIVERQRAEIAEYQFIIAELQKMNDLQHAENARLLNCIAALEREGIEDEQPYRGYKNHAAWARAVEYNESPASDGQDGRIDNR